MIDILNLYERVEDLEEELGIVEFKKVKYEDIKIFGKTLDEVATILNGLEIERITDIKMTMENLSYLYKELMKEQYKYQQEAIKNIFNLNG